MNEGWSISMERRVKERLIGATILVVLIVLVVPELLSGPKRPQSAMPALQTGASEAIRSVTVDLATNQATAAVDESASAASAVASAPAASAAAAPHDGSPDGEAGRGSTAAGAAPNSAPTQAPMPAPSMHVGWAAQLGSFVARANAEKLDRKLRAEGFAASLSSSGVGQAVVYRVRVGPMADRVAAERLVAKLKRAGYAASLVPSG